jgi:hypothetical protein
LSPIGLCVENPRDRGMEGFLSSETDGGAGVGKDWIILVEPF